MNKDFSHFKKLLEEEETRLESELGDVGRKVPGTSNDWEATVEEGVILDEADPLDRADNIEEFSGRIAIETELEARLIEVKNAKQKIEDGTYGVCSVCGEEIEEDRLGANPAAATCKKHMNG